MIIIPKRVRNYGCCTTNAEERITSLFQCSSLLSGEITWDIGKTNRINIFRLDLGDSNLPLSKNNVQTNLCASGHRIFAIPLPVVHMASH